MDGVTDEDLKNGKEGMKVGKGWSDMKYSLDLEEGQEQKLFWHRAETKHSSASPSTWLRQCLILRSQLASCSNKYYLADYKKFNSQKIPKRTRPSSEG
ncbi:hypothetical protein Bca101_068268 [Brassica carinata]